MVTFEHRENAEAFIEHFGKKGMRWGRRMAYNKSQQQERNRRKQISAKRQYLSDSDLQSYVSRLNTERKLKDMIDTDLSPGKTAAKHIMTKSGQQIASTVVAAFAVYGIKKVVEKKFNMKL